MQEKKPRINCSIFQKQEPQIKDIINAINESGSIYGKAYSARELQKEVNVLLACPSYKEESLDCKNCRLVTNMRRKMAELIIKTEELEDEEA